MSKKHFTTYTKRYSYVAILLVALTAPQSVAARDVVKFPCAEAETVPLNTSLHGFGRPNGESAFYKMEVPAAGIVTLDVAVPGHAEAAAKLGLFDRGCKTTDRSQDTFIVIEQTPTGLIAWTEAPGTYVFGVAAQNPRDSLGDYKLTTAFVEVSHPYVEPTISPIESDEEIEIEPNVEGDLPFVNKNEDSQVESDEEIEIEPNAEGDLPFVNKNEDNQVESDEEIEIEPNAEGDLPFVNKNEDNQVESDEEIEIEPNAEGDLPFVNKNEDNQVESDEEIEIEPNREGGEIEPNPSGASPHDPWPSDDILLAAMRQLCGRLKTDDHGDTPTCATWIRPGRKVKGTLQSFGSNDYDYFIFELLEPRTIHLATAGPTDTFGVLFDSYGHRLAADDSSGGLANFRMVKTLGPGLYYVRVEGPYRTEGLYTLHLETSSW